MPKPAIMIGIDPGVNTGFAVWNTVNKEFDELMTVDVFDCMKELQLWQGLTRNSLRVYIENPNLNRPTFVRKGQSIRAMQKISQNVGSNKRDAQLLIDFCKKQGIDCQPVRPVRKKLCHSDFVRITKYQKRVSQHARDAAMLVWGR